MDIMAFITTLVIGIVCIALGISHTKGNISSLHSYHRKRVSEEDRLPFGRLVGLGTIICGVAIIVFGAFMVAASYFEAEALSLVGTAVMIAGLFVGLCISFYAMIKYNKGIF